MSHICFMYWAIIFYGIRCAVNYETVMKNHNTCKDDLCLINNHNLENINNNNKQTLKINHSNFANDSKYLNESEIYFVTVSEKSLDVNKNNFDQKHQKLQTTNDIKLKFFFETTEKNNLSIDYIEELSNMTDIADISEITTLNFLSSTVEPNFTKTISTSTIKSSISTTQPPFITSHFLLSESFKKNKKICFCDMEVNKCDVNCCCDKDCNFSHFKVFTKCSDENMMFDARYCYKNNFIFGNNTYKEKMLSKEGLFCIVKENLKFDLMFETKPILRTLEAFNKSLPKSSYIFSHKSPEKLNLINKDYVFGSPVWSVQKGELIPFKIPYSSVGLLCNSEINIKYLVDQLKICFYPQHIETQCKGSKIKDVLQHLKETKIISNPNILYKSQSFKSSEEAIEFENLYSCNIALLTKLLLLFGVFHYESNSLMKYLICKANVCIDITSYFCQSIGNTADCSEISENSNDFSKASCWNALSHIQYQIWHNGSKGITKMEAYLWIKKLPKISNEFLSQIVSEVRFSWVGLSKKIFKKSGNPGYLTGKPILAGKKIYNVVNDTSNKKEAIELSDDPKDWLSVLGSEKGICSSKRRIPINFRENSQNKCSLKLNKNNFSKEKCMELQINIFELLIGNEIINDTKENFFNKFVATFGNSKVEETGDWVQVLIDLFPIISSQVGFKSSHYHLICKNIITDLYIDIVYSNIGSFLAPQAKILGVAFKFGKHKDLSYYCDTPGCKNTSSVQYFKLSSAVHFIDTSKPAMDAFAEPLSLEAKLPHDFFYPFFSKSSKCQIFNDIILILFCVNLLFLF